MLARECPIIVKRTHAITSLAHDFSVETGDAATAILQGAAVLAWGNAGTASVCTCIVKAIGADTTVPSTVELSIEAYFAGAALDGSKGAGLAVICTGLAISINRLVKASVAKTFADSSTGVSNLCAVGNTSQAVGGESLARGAWFLAGIAIGAIEKVSGLAFVADVAWASFTETV